MLQLAMRTAIILATAVGGGFAVLGIPNEIIRRLPIGSAQDPIGRALLWVLIGFLLGFALGIWLASLPGMKTTVAVVRWQQTVGAATIAVVICAFVAFVM